MRAGSEETDRPAPHLDADGPAARPEYQDRPRDHAEPRMLAARPADRHQPAAHRPADALSRRPVDEDRPVGHAAPAARIGPTGVIAGRTADLDETAFHLGTRPVPGVPGDADRSARHPGAQVPAGVAMDEDRAVGHATADLVDATQIALEIDPAVRDVARDREAARQARNDGSRRRSRAARSRPATYRGAGPV